MSGHDPYPPESEAFPRQDGVYEIPLMSPADQRTWSVVAHLAGFAAAVLGTMTFLGPLAVYLILNERGAFVRRHSAEALNFQLTCWITALALVVASFASLGLLLVVTIPLGIVLAIVYLVIPIIAAVKASKGEHWRLPLTIRFVS